MSNEYVRLNSSEMVYGEKNLLHAQLEFLDAIKRFEIYKNLRGEEFIFRIGVKNKIQAIMEELKRIDGFLPKTEFQAPDYILDIDEKISPEQEKLYEEVEELKRKIERLQREID